MEPQTRYVRSADGTRIGMWMIGRGQPLVVSHPVAIASIDARWQSRQYREGIQRLAQNRMVVLYDIRGFGLSQRETNDLSLEARMNDLKAVIDGVSASSVDLMGMWTGAAVSITYAAAYPEKVRRLVLRNPMAGGRDVRPTPLQRILRPLIESDWPAYVRHASLDGFGWEDGRQVSESAIQSVTPEMFVAAGRAARGYDVTELLPGVRCLTLVLHRRVGNPVPLEHVSELTAAIPNARLIQFESNQPMMVFSEEAAVRIVEEFLDQDEAVPTDSPELPSGTAIILFADIVDSTPLTERLGDKAFREKARELDAALRKIIRDASGTCIDAKTLGDGVLATFTSAAQAIEAALACSKSGDDSGLPLHLGLHAGDVIREENNVFGGAVNIAARISGLSAPGEVLVSDTVRSLARTSAGVSFEDRGEQSLKGVGETVRVFSVRGDD